MTAHQPSNTDQSTNELRRFYLMRNVWIETVTRHTEFSPWTRVIGVDLACWTSWREPWCWPSMDRIAKDVGCKRHTVIRAVAELELARFITVQRKKRGGNRYAIRLPVEYNVAVERLLNVAG